MQLVIPKAGPSGELWDVSFKCIETGACETREYDYVFVCNGHYNTPFIPNIPGLKQFEGDINNKRTFRIITLISWVVETASTYVPRHNNTVGLEYAFANRA